MKEEDKKTANKDQYNRAAQEEGIYAMETNKSGQHLQYSNAN